MVNVFEISRAGDKFRSSFGLVKNVPEVHMYDMYKRTYVLDVQNIQNVSMHEMYKCTKSTNVQMNVMYEINECTKCTKCTYVQICNPFLLSF